LCLIFCFFTKSLLSIIIILIIRIAPLLKGLRGPTDIML